MYRFVTLLCFIVIFPTSVFSQEIQDFSNAINIAGKQRMLTQRMLKDYAMIGMKNHFGDPKKDLDSVMNSFDVALVKLHNFSNNKQIQEKIEELKKFWLPLKSKLSAKASFNKAQEIQAKLDELLTRSDEIVVLLTKEAKSKSADIINISGRQRMLSQKMAALYMLKVWGLRDSDFDKKLQASIHLFKESHERLLHYEKNSDEIKKLLSKVAREFKFFEFMSHSKSRFIPSLIYKKSNEILRDMDRVTKLYTDKELK